MKKLRMFWFIVRRCHFEVAFLGFIAAFLLSPLVLTAAEPGIGTYREGLWYCFVACTSIGFGDIVPVTFAGRLLTILLTVWEIVLVAILSGVIVSYYLEAIQMRERETATAFLDKLSHLTELSQEELEEIQDRVRKLT